MRNRWIVLLELVLVIAAGAYFIHGANQVGILNGLLLNGDAWDDPSKGLALMIAGGVMLVVIVLVAVLVRLQTLTHLLNDASNTRPH